MVYLAEVVALSGAVTWGVSHNLIKAGLKGFSPRRAALVVTVASFFFLWPIALLVVPLKTFAHPAILIFLMDGLMVPGLARILLYSGIERVGVSRSSAISGANPTVSIIMALLLFGEKVSLLGLLGALSVILGVVLVSYQEEKAQWQRRDLLFPAGAALFYGLSPIIRKWGLSYIPSSLVATAVGNSSALAFHFLTSLPFRTRMNPGLARLLSRQGRDGPALKSLGYLAAAAMMAAAGEIIYNLALKLGDVVMVAPLGNTFPFFAILIAVVLTGERVTAKLLAGAVMVVGGAGVMLFY